MVILEEEEEEEEEENEIDFQVEPEVEGANRPMPTSFRRISKKKGRKLYSKHKHHSKHRCDLLVDYAYYPRYKIVDYDEDNLKMKLIRVYPRIVDDGDGGGGDVVGIDNGDIVVDGNGGGGGDVVVIDNGDIVVDGNGGDGDVGDRSGDVVGIDNGDIVVDGNGDGGVGNGGYGEKKGNLKMKIIFDS